MKIFIDTSAFIAFSIVREINHQKVVEKYNFYKANRANFFTSDYILDELFTHLAYRLPSKLVRNTVKAIGHSIKAGDLNLIYINPSNFLKAQLLFLKYLDHKISFTDVASFVLSKEYEIDEIFTLDSDFKRFHIRTSF